MLSSQHRSQTFGAGPAMGFSGKTAKSEFRPRWESEVGNPTSVEESRPWRGLGRAMPGSWGLAAGKKKLQVLPPHDNLDILGRTGLYFFLVCRAGRAMPGRFAETVGLDDSFEFFFLGRIPTLARARTECQPAEPSLSPGSLLYVLYVLYLTRQATEHPLSPGFLAICAICAISHKASH